MAIRSPLFPGDVDEVGHIARVRRHPVRVPSRVRMPAELPAERRDPCAFHVGVEPAEAALGLINVMTRIRLVSVLVWTSLAALTVACGAATEPPTARSGLTSEPEPSTSKQTSTGGGDAAVWDLGLDQRLQRSSTRFTALVSRLDCNNGITGEVSAPEIHISESEVVVTFSVAPMRPHAAACPANDQVPYTVDLGEPLRDRALVDGRCLAGGEAATTSFCATGPTRFRP